MVIDISKIKPQKRGESDKYSWNLYNFLDKLFKKSEGEYYRRQLEIHWLHYSRWDGKYLEFDKNNLHLYQLVILPLGLGNGITFYSMKSALQKGRATEFAIPSSWEKKMLTNITNWFLKTYERDGLCIFDREHNGWMLGAKDRFTYINNTRRCNWCGEWHIKEIKKIQTIKREEVWNRVVL